MRSSAHYQICIFLLITVFWVAGCEKTQSSIENPVVGWAILAEKDDYEGVKGDLLVDYIDIIRMRQVLENSGWKSDQIHDLREFNREDLLVELDWLERHADENDIVVMYVTAHGDYLKDVIKWRDFFGDEWAQIPSKRRILIVDCSWAAHFTNATINDPSPHLSIAAVDANEISWKATEDEGLPIIGGVFTNYFVEALEDPNADTNNDGFISVQEAALIANEKQRTFMHNFILVEPEFLKIFHARAISPERDPTYPHVIMDDTIDEPVYLTLDAYP